MGDKPHSLNTALLISLLVHAVVIAVSGKLFPSTQSSADNGQLAPPLRLSMVTRDNHPAVVVKPVDTNNAPLPVPPANTEVLAKPATPSAPAPLEEPLEFIPEKTATVIRASHSIAPKHSHRPSAKKRKQPTANIPSKNKAPAPRAEPPSAAPPAVSHTAKTPPVSVASKHSADNMASSNAPNQTIIRQPDNMTGPRPDIGLLLNRIRAAVEHNKRYPHIARRRGQQGTVTLAFLLHTNGHLANVNVFRTSGYRPLDQAALAAIKAVAPLPSAAEYLSKSTAMHLDVAFVLR